MALRPVVALVLRKEFDILQPTLYAVSLSSGLRHSWPMQMCQVSGPLCRMFGIRFTNRSYVSGTEELFPFAKTPM